MNTEETNKRIKPKPPNVSIFRKWNLLKIPLMQRCVSSSAVLALRQKRQRSQGPAIQGAHEVSNMRRRAKRAERARRTRRARIAEM